MKHIFFLLIMLMSAFLPPVIVLKDPQQASALTKATDLQTIESSFNFTYSKAFSNNSKQNLDPSVLKLNETLDTISSFVAPEVDVFLDNDSIPDFSNISLRKVRVTLTQATILSDKDSFDNYNEIYFITQVNHRKIETGLYTGVAVNDTIHPNVVIFEDWCLISESVIIEVAVWEADTLHIDDDSMGNLTLIKPDMPNIYTVFTNTADANVTLDIEVLSNKYGITARELLNGFKPYIWMASEVNEQKPDAVYARVLKRNDSYLGREALCLQYYLYWNKEFFPFNLSQIWGQSELHIYDYEVFLVFLDPQNISKPFRLVYDIGGYISVDGWYYHKLTIWEKDAISADYTDQTVEVNPVLAPFLGAYTSMDYNVRPLSELSFHRGTLGTQVVTITVQTAFHTFESGPAQGFQIFKHELGFEYDIDDFTDDIIYSWYSNYQEALQNGSYTIGLPILGYYVSPIVSPFPYDVSNPFAFPHATNAWKNLWENITAFELAKTGLFDFDSLLSGMLDLVLPMKMSLTLPKQVIASKKFEAQVDLELDPDKADFKVDYEAGQNLGLRAWFLQSLLNYTINGGLDINFSVQTVVNLLTNLTANAQTGNSSLTSEILEVEYSHINPLAVGTIANISTRLHLWEAVETVLAYIPMVNLSNLFIETVDLQPKILLTSLADGKITTDSNLAAVSNSSLQFDENNVQTVEINVNQWLKGQNFTVEVKDISYAAQLSIDWYFHLNFRPPYDSFLGNHSWHLGTFPVLSLTENQLAFLTTILSILAIISVLSDSTITIPVPAFEAVVILFSMTLILLIKSLYYRNHKNQTN